jgi:hypothetical protein
MFKPATNSMAYLKAGIMGFQGSGKTHTSVAIAVGLMLHMRERKLEAGMRPVFFLDTETGSDWVKPLFDEHGIELQVAKTRAFDDLIPAVNEAEKAGSVLIIDSITHFWRDLTESYARAKNRFRLQFEDWAYLKKRWGEYTDRYVNSWVHIIMAGRAGYEYDFFEDEETKKKELEKTGIRMKAEGETGFEPSLLILMERKMDISGDVPKMHFEAHVLKDRSRRIDGKTFIFDHNTPLLDTYSKFAPHIEYLNLGGQHFGVDTSRTTDIPDDKSKRDWRWREQQRAIILDRIKAAFVEAGMDGNSADVKKRRIELLRECFKTNSWIEIESRLALEEIEEGHDRLILALHPEKAKEPEEAVK